MSRIGKLPIEIPEKVTVDVNENRVITVKGPKGELKKSLPPLASVQIEDRVITVERQSDDKNSKAAHGLTRALIANFIEGVNTGFSKKLQIIGVGYKAEMRGQRLLLNLGYSHPILVNVTNDVTIDTPSPTEIVVSGIDKEKVGLVAAKIRSFRKPEPYKGKGVRYEGEYVRRKAGKTTG